MASWVRRVTEGLLIALSGVFAAIYDSATTRVILWVVFVLLWIVLLMDVCSKTRSAGAVLRYFGLLAKQESVVQPAATELPRSLGVIDLINAQVMEETKERARLRVQRESEESRQREDASARASSDDIAATEVIARLTRHRDRARELVLSPAVDTWTYMQCQDVADNNEAAAKADIHLFSSQHARHWPTGRMMYDPLHPPATMQAHFRDRMRYTAIQLDKVIDELRASEAAHDA